MSAAPTDLTSDMAAIAEHHEEGIRLHREGGFTEEEWSEHQRITYTALMVLVLNAKAHAGGSSRIHVDAPRNALVMA
ncbi:hypothetical protein [Synechococcus sp. UW69]|uniref:hypothetical protein n=1 Tax=Synechococcus sp. UW69 TaxID=368493 RepID=UPI0010BD64D3|nr:hypothetical protein [Synechococcus sp. UW69]